MAQECPKMPETATSITGRDGYITMKAMLYAIATIKSLPAVDREYGDMVDMQKLIRDMIRQDMDVPVLCHAMLEVNRHTGEMPELFPVDFGEELFGIHDQREIALWGAIQVTIENMKKDMAAFLARFNRDEGLGEAA